jgi:hypothetical protein
MSATSSTSNAQTPVINPNHNEIYYIPASDCQDLFWGTAYYQLCKGISPTKKELKPKRATFYFSAILFDQMFQQNSKGFQEINVESIPLLFRKKIFDSRDQAEWTSVKIRFQREKKKVTVEAHYKILSAQGFVDWFGVFLFYTSFMIHCFFIHDLFLFIFIVYSFMILI